MSDDLKLFIDHKDAIVRLCVDVSFPEGVPKHIKESFREAINYNTTGGKFFRGVSVLRVLRALAPAQFPSVVELALTSGWLVELMQAYFLMLDDIEDHSELRRGRLCWYKKEGIGMNAINDALMIEMTIFQVIKRTFCSHPSYVKIMELFFETIYTTSIGQSMDLHFSSKAQMDLSDLSDFTLENYFKIVFNKTTFYTFICPFKVALLLSGVELPATMIDDCVKLLTMIGSLFQVQDDYLDVYGDPDVMGKVGTDIQDGKCSWLTVKVLTLLSDSELELFRKHYGKSDTCSVDFIRNTYERHSVKTLYEEYVDCQMSLIHELTNSKLNPPLAGFYTSFVSSFKSRIN